MSSWFVYSFYYHLVATLTTIEHVFSQGRHLLQFTPSRLSGGTWNWVGLITVEDQMPLDKDKGKRKYVEVNTIDLTSGDGDVLEK